MFFVVTILGLLVIVAFIAFLFYFAWLGLVAIWYMLRPSLRPLAGCFAGLLVLVVLLGLVK